MPSGSRYNDGNFVPWGERDWAKGDALKGWEDFYGYAGQYRPGDQPTDPRTATTGVDEHGNPVNYGIGFGGGDLRKAANRGYSATSIMNYLSGADGGGGYSGVIPQTIKNQLRERMATEEGMYVAWDKYKDKFSSLSDKIDNFDLSDYAKTSDVQTNTANIQKAMQEAQKVRQNNPYAVTGNTAMGIQQASSPSQVAGQISAGLAGFSRDNKKFQNKTINV